jgi:4-hydroxybenzoate polyprenyltransferase
MGACRSLNVLLGVSIAGSLARPLGPYLALVVGLYIVGVTWFARTEAAVSSRQALGGAALTILVSLLLTVPVPVMRSESLASPLFVYLLVLFGFWLGFALWRAIESPTPGHVQTGVKRALMGLILLDTTLALATAGTVGLVLLALLVPSLYLNRQRWLYAT